MKMMVTPGSDLGGKIIVRTWARTPIEKSLETKRTGYDKSREFAKSSPISSHRGGGGEATSLCARLRLRLQEFYLPNAPTQRDPTFRRKSRSPRRRCDTELAAKQSIVAAKVARRKQRPPLVGSALDGRGVFLEGILNVSIDGTSPSRAATCRRRALRSYTPV